VSGAVTDSADALRAALEAAGLSPQAVPEEQRAMFNSLTEEEVTRLIRMCAGRSAAEVGEPATDRPAELDGQDASGDSGAAAVPRQGGHSSSDG
jgi:hypothetical protein